MSGYTITDFSNKSHLGIHMIPVYPLTSRHQLQCVTAFWPDSRVVRVTGIPPCLQFCHRWEDKFCLIVLFFWVCLPHSTHICVSQVPSHPNGHRPLWCDQRACISPDGGFVEGPRKAEENEMHLFWHLHKVHTCKWHISFLSKAEGHIKTQDFHGLLSPTVIIHPSFLHLKSCCLLHSVKLD